MNDMLRRRAGGFVLLFAASVVLTAACGSADGRTVNVLFRDAEKLEPGDPVRYQGFEVGRVEALQPVPGNVTRVRVVVGSDHRDLLREGLGFSIEPAPGDGNGQVLEMSVPDRDAPMLRDSATVVAETDGWRSVIDRFRETDWREVGETSRREAEALLRKLKDDVDWEEIGEQARRDVTELLEELRRTADSLYEGGG